MKTYEVSIISLDCSTQGEIMSISIEPSPSTEVIAFDWSNLRESRIHFQISMQVTARSMLCTIVDEGASISILSSTTWKAPGFP